MEIVLATNNQHKIREIKDILEPYYCRLITLHELGVQVRVEEDGISFRENAYKKALAAAKACGRTVLADDSGLEVDCLGGAPGVHSARYAHESATDAENNTKLLAEMAGVRERRARFCCLIALVTPDGKAGYAKGVCEGSIVLKPTGKEGFGYDPLFVPVGYRKTMAELGPQIKNRISHRARALQQLPELIGILGSVDISE